MSKVIINNQVKFEIFKALISSGKYGTYHADNSIGTAIEDMNAAYDKLIIEGVIREPEEYPDEIGESERPSGQELPKQRERKIYVS